MTYTLHNLLKDILTIAVLSAMLVLALEFGAKAGDLYVDGGIERDDPCAYSWGQSCYTYKPEYRLITGNKDIRFDWCAYDKYDSARWKKHNPPDFSGDPWAYLPSSRAHCETAYPDELSDARSCWLCRYDKYDGRIAKRHNPPDFNEIYCDSECPQSSWIYTGDKKKKVGNGGPGLSKTYTLPDNTGTYLGDGIVIQDKDLIKYRKQIKDLITKLKGGK